MGGGKRNYNSMRQQFRKKVTKETPIIDTDLKTPDPENAKSVLELWKKAKNTLSVGTIC